MGIEGVGTSCTKQAGEGAFLLTMFQKELHCMIVEPEGEPLRGHANDPIEDVAWVDSQR